MEFLIAIMVILHTLVTQRFFFLSDFNDVLETIYWHTLTHIQTSTFTCKFCSFVSFSYYKYCFFFISIFHSKNGKFIFKCGEVNLKTWCEWKENIKQIRYKTDRPRQKLNSIEKEKEYRECISWIYSCDV